MQQRPITNLTDTDIETVCGIIDGWPRNKKLTWDLLVEAVEKRLHKRWSRQAFDRHKIISETFKIKKRAARDLPVEEEDIPVDLRKAREAIERLESENKRLKQENNNLLERFVRYVYNAYARGLSERDLERPLPQVQRGGTR